MEPIATQRLVVRRFSTSDATDFLAYQRLPDVLRYLPDEPMSDEQAASYLAKQASLADNQKETYHAFAVYHVGDAQVIGDVGLFLAAGPEHNGDLGFQFHPTYHGQGYAHEAARAVLRLGFMEWDLRRITASCDARNSASFGLMQRLGMRREAHFWQSQITKGVLHDEYAYALLRDEWLAQQAL